MDSERKNKRNIKPFDGSNYNIWKFRLRSLLKRRGVLYVIDEQKPQIPNKKWNKHNDEARDEILSYLADSLIGYAKNENTTAREIFLKLDAVYDRKSTPEEWAVRQKLMNLRLKSDTPLQVHFQEFDKLVMDLCSAGGEDMSEKAQIGFLVGTLSPSYHVVITSLAAVTEGTTSLEFVKNRLLDEEIRLKQESTDTSTKVLLTNTDCQQNNFKKRSNNYRNFKSKKYNGKHKKSFYKFNNQSSKNTNVICYHCGRTGHIKNECRFFKKAQQLISDYKNKNSKVNSEVNVATPVKTQEAANITSTFNLFMLGYKNLNDMKANKKMNFILDSGATDHMINSYECLSEIENLNPPIKVTIAKTDMFITATKKGHLTVKTDIGTQCTLRNILYCPELPINIISINRANDAGMEVIFKQSSVKIINEGRVIIAAQRTEGTLPRVTLEPTDATIKTGFSASKIKGNYDVWHKRLGHISKTKFNILKDKKMVDDISLLNDVELTDKICESCIYGKMTRLPFNKSKNKAYINRPLINVHSDVCGPITPSTIDNKNYFVTFIEEFTHYCVIYLITYKSDVFHVYKDFIQKAESHFNLKLENLYIDNGREYLSNEMKNFCKDKGISYHLTIPDTPQLNGLAERMNRTITEKARSMLNCSKLSKEFWGEAVITATYLINLTPTKALKLCKTPYELWHNKKPQLKYLRIFGSTVYVNDKKRKHKFQDKAWKGIMVGYVPNGYKVFDSKTNKFVNVRDVIIDEVSYLETRPILDFDNDIGTNNDKDSLISIDNINKNMTSEINDDWHKNINKFNESHDWYKNRPNNQHDKSDFAKSDEEDIDEPSETDKTRAAYPKKDKINKKQKFDSSQSDKIFTDNCRRSDRIKNMKLVNYDLNNSILDNVLLRAESVANNIPHSFQEIKDRSDKDKWQKAINEELTSLQINHTWSFVPRPLDKNIVDCKWIFNIKTDELGNPVRYKARLVARGFSQEYLTDYFETFAPVARFTSFRFLLAFANQFGLLVHHMDVKTAFLNGTLKEEIYMKVPEGVEAKENEICKLNKALYGLKQSARCWFEVFESTLKEKGFRNSPVDRCVYLLDKGSVKENIYVLLYVDDLVIMTANNDVMNEFKNYLTSKFCMTDLKDIKLFLGVKIIRENTCITLDQSNYIKLVLNKFKMNDCNPVSTPMECKVNYDALNSNVKYDAPSQSLLGCLMYIMICSRPDISNCINILSRFANKNNKEMWTCLKRVVRYLKGTAELKLTFKRKDNYFNILIGYVDSDWGGDEIGRKSTTGFVFKLFENCVISWNTKRQHSVADSSTAAEYMALYECVKEALWLRSLAISINISINNPTLIYEDNNGCISIAKNPSSHKRSKHIDIKYHYSREQVEKGNIKLEHIDTSNQIADILTKPLPSIKFLKYRNELSLEL